MVGGSVKLWVSSRFLNYRNTNGFQLFNVFVTVHKVVKSVSGCVRVSKSLYKKCVNVRVLLFGNGF